MEFIATLNPEQASEEEVSKFAVRNAARAVVFDRDGNVGILNVSKKGFYKLPGGGIEEGEDARAALHRECREELGCNIEIAGEIGEIVEYRKMFRLKQTSSCFLANLVGEKGEPAFEPDELEDGFQVEWLPAEKALSLLAAGRPAEKEAAWYMAPRDTIVLKTTIDKIHERKI